MKPAVSTSAILVSIIASLGAAVMARAQDVTWSQPMAQRAAVDVDVRHDFHGAETWRGLAPEIVVSDRKALWSDSRGDRDVVVHYGSRVGSTGRPDDRTDFAQSLLLPGHYTVWIGSAGEWRTARDTRIVFPDARVGAMAVPWRGDTTAYRMELSGGAAVRSHSGVCLSLHVRRALNAIGRTDRRHVLTALGGPGLWATSLETAVGYTPGMTGVLAFATFGAYLGDSKFHVPPDGRSIISVGVSKAMGARRSPE